MCPLDFYLAYLRIAPPKRWSLPLQPRRVKPLSSIVFFAPCLLEVLATVYNPLHPNRKKKNEKKLSIDLLCHRQWLVCSKGAACRMNLLRHIFDKVRVSRTHSAFYVCRAASLCRDLSSAEDESRGTILMFTTTSAPPFGFASPNFLEFSNLLLYTLTVFLDHLLLLFFHTSFSPHITTSHQFLISLVSSSPHGDYYVCIKLRSD